MRDQATQDLITAVNRNDTEATYDALLRGANPNVQDGGNTPLMTAARNGNGAIITLLVAYKADVGAYVSGLSAFNVAVMHKQFGAAETLRGFGADTNGQWNPGRSTTPLHSCIILDAEEGVDARTAYLLSRGADTTVLAYVGRGVADTVGDALEQARLQPRGQRLVEMIEKARPAGYVGPVRQINHARPQ